MNKPDERADLSGLTTVDRLIHEPARLAVMALLYVVDSADFIFIMNQTNLTWGNLSAHVSKLEEAGYILVEKTFKGKRPNTLLSLTSTGREAFQSYVQRMKKILRELPE